MGFKDKAIKESVKATKNLLDNTNKHKNKGAKVRLSDEGKKETLIEGIADHKMKNGMTSEQAYDEAERLVGTGTHETEPTKGGFSFYNDYKIRDDFKPKKDKVKLGAALTAGTGVVAASESLKDNKETPIETPEFKPKEAPKAKKDTAEAEKVIKNPDTRLDEENAIDKLLSGAVPQMATVGKQQITPYSYDNTQSAADLKDELTEVGNQFEVELNKLDDERSEKKERIAMGSIFKALIDAAALMYLAKHAPEAKYVGQTNPEEYQKELDRLDTHMAEQRGLIQDRFKELRSQIKDSYKTKERYEEKAADRAHRDRQTYASDQFRADLATAEASHRGALADRRDQISWAKDKLKQIHKDKKEQDKLKAEQDKPSLTDKQLMDENQQSIKVLNTIMNKMKSGEISNALELKNDLSLAGFSEKNADEITKHYSSPSFMQRIMNSDNINIDPEIKKANKLHGNVLTQDLLTNSTPAEGGVKKSKVSGGSSSKHEKAIKWLNSPAAAEDPEKAKKVLEKLQSELGSK